MRHRIPHTIALGLGLAPAVLALLCPPAPAAKPVRGDETTDSYVTLFNGKDLSGFHGARTQDPRKFAALGAEEKAKQLAEDAIDARKHWTVDKGELVNDGHGVYLTADKDYGDAEFTVDYKLIPKGDSGVYLRGTPQVQVWDYTDSTKFNLGSDKGSGGLWNNADGHPGKHPLVLADKPIGQWNSFRIIQVGQRTTIYLNGKLVVDHAALDNYWNKALPIPAKGPFQLQTHGNEVRWRNIKVREIGPDEANKILASHGAKGFTPIFNGRDLAGWAGPVKNYEVAVGAIRCKPHNGGTIYYNKELTDFAARVEFKLPAGGNNGLAIRYPGEGDTAYVGMCELQVLDDGDKRYAKLDPRQAHGSAYGMAAAHRGYLRPVGQWNFQEVTIKGSTIKVELNGTVILDADLSKVKDFMAKSPHPGKDRTSGYFGFAGHGDAVEFRNVSLKPLD